LQLENTISSGPDWSAIRHDYAANELRVDEICVAHGVDRRELYRKVKEQGWPLRQPWRSTPPMAPQDALFARLTTVLRRKMRQFEIRLKDLTAVDSAADSERDARTLSTLVRLFEKLNALQAASAGKPASSDDRANVSKNTAPASPDASTKDTHDQERLRGELARRLDALKAQIGG
jgi:hypothetical protein